MNFRKVLFDLFLRITLLIFQFNSVKTIDKEIPSFIEVPSSIQYYANIKSSVELKCKIWPSTAKVQFMISSKKMWPTVSNPFKNIMELNLLDKNIGELVSPGHLRINNQIHLKNIQDQNIHCLASTDFATILSNPFKITRAGMSNFGGDLTNQSKIVEKRFLQDNVAIIDCWPPESHPRADVRFNFNDMEIKDGGKYRIIHWPDGKRVSLLIHPVQESDNGEYSCLATNPVTQETKTSPEITSLKVEVTKMSIPPSITIPISGRLNGPQQIIVQKGSNVTLFCVMRGNPSPKIRTFIYNTDLPVNPRHTVDPAFGLLHIKEVQSSDAGNYMCSETHITNSAVLKVVDQLNITSRPVSVVLDSLMGSAVFHCGLSKSAIVPQWFFNGRPINASPNGSLVIPVVAASSLGVYQCVAQDHEEWRTASATLTLRSYNLLTRPLSPDQPTIQAPLQQSVDLQEEVLSAPNVSRIHDNMAIYVSWHHRKGKVGVLSRFVLEYQHQGRHEGTWSTPVIIQDTFNHSYYYVTDRYVSAQNAYRFRVHAFYNNKHTVTSIVSKVVDFFNVGDTAPVIDDSSVKAPGTVVIRWSYHSAAVWPVDTFRILVRQQLTNGSQATKRFDKYFKVDVPFPTMSATIENLEVEATYQVIIYGINSATGSRTITKYSQLHTIVVPRVAKIPSATTPASKNSFFVGLFESWKSNKLLYGSLFALTGFLILVMFLLLLLCLCRQRRFRNNKDTSSSHTFPYAYKEVNKSSVTASNSNNNNNSSTLQIPGRMPQYSSQLALQQFQSRDNTASIDRRTTDMGSHLPRDNSAHAMETASLVTDLYSQNYMMHGPQIMGHMQHHPYQGFSTLPAQGYPSAHPSRNHPQYQHFLQQQQQLGGIRRDGHESNRDSILDPSLEMPSRGGMSASQQQLMMMGNPGQHESHQRGYYSGRPGAMSPQMMMMMGSQQSLGPYGPYRRSNSNQNYQGVIETPIALSATGHPMYQIDTIAMDPSARPISPQYQYMQQQQQMAQQASMHPAMIDMYNQSHGYVRSAGSEYTQHSLYRQQYRRSDSDCGGGMEPGYSYLPPNTHGAEVMGASRQHTLNSLPEQPIDLGNNNQPQDSPGQMAPSNSNNNSSGRHHHRRKTRARQQSSQEHASLERVQGGNLGDMPPMLAPRSKMPYHGPDNIHRLSGHDVNTAECQDLAINDCNSETNTNGDSFDPPLQYSAHYDPHDPNDNDTTPNNSLLIENLPRIRDLSEYGIPINHGQNNNNNNNNMGSHQKQQRSLKQNHHLQQQQHFQVPVPPLKTTSRHNPGPNNGYNMECNPDYYSSATSSDRSGPSPPPKYAPTNVPMSRPDEVYMKNLYYHGDTHC